MRLTGPAHLSSACRGDTISEFQGIWAFPPTHTSASHTDAAVISPTPPPRDYDLSLESFHYSCIHPSSCQGGNGHGGETGV